MSYLFALIIIIASGYCMARLTGTARYHLMYDIPLAWFLGGGYISLLLGGWFVITGSAAGLAVSLVMLALPVAVFLLFRSRFPAEVCTASVMPRLAELLIIAIPIVAIGMMFLHGYSTPVVADDAFRVRAYHPMMVEMGLMQRGMVFFNGLWSNMLLPFFWSFSPELDKFFPKYLILTSYIFFAMLLYMVPALSGDRRRGALSLLFAILIPLPAYHATAAYLDIATAMPLALAFLFFSGFLRHGAGRELRLAIIFLTITALMKEKGFFFTAVCLGVVGFHQLYIAAVKKELSGLRELPYLAPFFIYMGFRWLNDPTAAALASQAVAATPLASTVFEKFSGFISSLFYSGNFGIHFYVLLGTLLVYPKRCFKGSGGWELLFFSAILGMVGWYMVIMFSDVAGFEAIVHRAIIAPATLAGIYIAGRLADASGRDGGVSLSA